MPKEHYQCQKSDRILAIPFISIKFYDVNNINNMKKLKFIP